MTFEEWVEKYKPIRDSFGDVAMFETYGKEREFIMKQNPLCIWTLCDAGEGSFILSGWHFVNRIGYYITEIPVETGDCVFVDIESENDEEEEEE